MRKDWLWIGLAAALLAACSTTEQQAPAPQQPAYNGPVVEIGGVEPKYEPLNPNSNQDYSMNGKNYRIVKDPSNFSETGLATWYGDEASGNRTASGEQFDPEGLTAAHPTLPIWPTGVSWWCALTIAVLTRRAGSSICRKQQAIV